MSQTVYFLEKKDEDEDLILDLERCLQLSPCDMSIFFRELTHIDWTKSDLLQQVNKAFYVPSSLVGNTLLDWEDWFRDYEARWKEEAESSAVRQEGMRKVNPKYVLRNYMAQLAIEAAEAGDFELIDELHELLKKPYDEQPKHEKWYAQRPDWAKNKVGSSMLSCSS